MVLIGLVVAFSEIFMADVSGWDASTIVLLAITEGCAVAFAIFLKWKMNRRETGYANTALFHVVDALVVQAIALAVATIFGGVAALIAAIVSGVLFIAHVIIGIIELRNYRYHYDINWARMSLYPLITGALGLIVSLNMYFIGRV